MRNTIIALLAAFAGCGLPSQAAAQDQPPSADECEIIIDTTDEAMAVLQASGLDFAGYDTLCPLLRDAGMGIAADASFGPVVDRSYGLVVARLYHIDTGVRGWRFISSTGLNEDMAEATAEQAMIDTVNRAAQTISEMPLDMISSVEEEIARLRPIANAPVPAVAPRAGDCLVSFHTTEEFLPLVNEWTDISLASNPLCERMAAAGVGLRMTDDAGELAGRTYGWVRINLYDAVTQVNSSYRTTTISLAGAGVEDARDAVLREALIVSLRNLEENQDLFFSSLTDEVAKVRQALAGAGS